MKRATALLLFSMGPVFVAQGDVFSVGAPIPDGNASGLANVQTITGVPGRVWYVTLGLNISGVGDGAYNGDLYATLQHFSTTAVSPCS
jgi:hypothetical protein